MHKDAKRFDNVALKKAEITPEGYLKADAIVTRAGVFDYLNGDGTIRRELRHPEDVFHQDSLSSLKMRPITNGHPAQKLVDANNVKELAIGYTGESVNTLDNFVVSSILVTDGAGVAAIKANEKRQLSLGYTVDLIEEAGEYEGERYDYRQTNIRYNHLAIVANGRAGAMAAIHLDSKDACIVDESYTVNFNKESVMADEQMAVITLEGVEYQVAPEVVAAYDKMATSIAELQEKLAAVTMERDALAGERDALVEAKEEVVPEAVNMDAQIQAAVMERVKLLNSATKLTEVNLDSLSNESIKRTVVKQHCPNVALESKSMAYIDARFDALVENLEATLAKQAINKQRIQITPKLDSSDNKSAADARAKMIAAMQSGWKTIGNKGAK